MKKARKLSPSILFVFLCLCGLYLDHHFKFSLGKSNPVLDMISVVSAPIGNFLTQLERRAYDSYISSRHAQSQQDKITIIQKGVLANRFEENSPEYLRQLDELTVSTPTSRDIVVAAIDEKTLTVLNDWPIRRDRYAQFLERLFEKGKARTVAFDIVFSEEGDKEALNALKNLKGKVGPDLSNEIDELSKQIDFNLQLEQSFARYADRIVGGFSVLSKEEATIKDFSNVFFPADYNSYRLTERGIENQIMRNYGGTYNYAGLREIIKYNGFFNVSPDGDGIVREIALLNALPVKLKHKDGSVDPESWELFGSLGLETLNLLKHRSIGAPISKGTYLEMAVNSPFFSLKENSKTVLKQKLREILKGWNGGTEHQKLLLDKAWALCRFNMSPDFELLESALVLANIGEYSDMDAFLLSLSSFPMPMIHRILRNFEPQSHSLFPDKSFIELESNREMLKKVQGSIKPVLIEVLVENLWSGLLQHLILLHSFSKEDLSSLKKHFETALFSETDFLTSIYLEENLAKPENKVRMGSSSKIKVAYNATRQGYVQYSMIDIMQEEELEGMLFGFKTPKVTIEDALKDRIVILGPTALGINDWRATPTSSYMDGLEIHAHVLDNIRDEIQIMRPDGAFLLEFLVLLSLMFILPYCLTRLNAKFGALVSLLLAVGWLGFCYYSIHYNFSYYQFTQTVSFIGVVYVLITTYEYMMEEKEKKKTRDAFQHYVNASVVDSVLADPDMLKLGGQKRDMTVLFSDVRGFTTISEKLDATTLVALMNDYLEEMTNLVLESDGTLDKFIGDAVMAFWGAPLKQEDHAARATLTAIAMLKRMDTLTEEIKNKYDVDVAIGIGLNTGPMVVGNMGSKQRFNYTVLGDAVNLGARLEGQTKGYGVYLILSESTYNLVKDWAAGRLLDLIAVKGKTLPVKIFEVVGIKKEMSAEELRGLEEFDAAVHTYYFGRKFQEGIQVFKDLKKYRKGKDKACDLYIERCEDFAENPPPDNWDGSYVATSK